MFVIQMLYLKNRHKSNMYMYTYVIYNLGLLFKYYILKNRPILNTYTYTYLIYKYIRIHIFNL